jgi:transposase
MASIEYIRTGRDGHAVWSARTRQVRPARFKVYAGVQMHNRFMTEKYWHRAYSVIHKELKFNLPHAFRSCESAPASSWQELHSPARWIFSGLAQRFDGNAASGVGNIVTAASAGGNGNSQITETAPDHNEPSPVLSALIGKDGAMSIRYDENTKARAVRLVSEHRDAYDSEWAAMKAISGRLGMNPETLRKWVRQAEVDAGEAPGITTDAARAEPAPQMQGARIDDRILKAATSFFARECDPLHR